MSLPPGTACLENPDTCVRIFWVSIGYRMKKTLEILMKGKFTHGSKGESYAHKREYLTRNDRLKDCTLMKLACLSQTEMCVFFFFDTIGSVLPTGQRRNRHTCGKFIDQYSTSRYDIAAFIYVGWKKVWQNTKDISPSACTAQSIAVGSVVLWLQIWTGIPQSIFDNDQQGSGLSP